jgi:fatty-acyl-CoA synthase
MDSDGYLYIVDRAKDMIISGGENIYPAQVELAIHRHPAVLEAAVVGVPDAHWGESVKAYVVLKPEQHVDAEDISATVATYLGSYQKPKIVEFLDELPRTSAGKIAQDRTEEPGGSEPVTDGLWPGISSTTPCSSVRGSAHWSRRSG